MTSLFDALNYHLFNAALATGLIGATCVYAAVGAVGPGDDPIVMFTDGRTAAGLVLLSCALVSLGINAALYVRQVHRESKQRERDFFASLAR
jgi:hypothetical protein